MIEQRPHHRLGNHRPSAQRRQATHDDGRPLHLPVLPSNRGTKSGSDGATRAIGDDRAQDRCVFQVTLLDRRAIPHLDGAGAPEASATAFLRLPRSAGTEDRFRNRSAVTLNDPALRRSAMAVPITDWLSVLRS